MSKTKAIKVYGRWCPLAQSEVDFGEISRSTLGTSSQLSVAINRQISAADRPWTSFSAFTAVFGPEDDNSRLYDTIVAPAIPKVLRGGNCSFFAYGHSGSGKTHTIIGYDYDNEKGLGLYLAAARHLFDALGAINSEGTGQQFGIGCSLFELRNKAAFDLFNKRAECHIREGPDGRTHIRGETEMLDGGKVRVCPIVKLPCWTFESLRQAVTEALKHRAVGSSSVHDQSSRTHAVLELEIVNKQLVDGRQALYDRQSELVPVGKLTTDISIEESMKGLIRTAEGAWAPNPNYEINQVRIDAAEAEKAQFEARVAAAEKHIGNILESSNSPCLGGKMVFVDLAGAEYHQEKGVTLQTPKDRKSVV